MSLKPGAALLLRPDTATLAEHHASTVVSPLWNLTADHQHHDEDSGGSSGGGRLAAGITMAIILSLIVVFAVAGNLLVIAAIMTDRALRQTGNFFLVSLALADMLVAGAVMTFAVANDVMGRWPFGRVLCDVWLSADVMCSTASILNLCAVSLDRYLHIRSPLHYDRRVTPRRVLAVIALVWIMSALISFLPIQLGWHRLGISEPPATSTDGQLGDQNSTANYSQTAGKISLSHGVNETWRTPTPAAEVHEDDEQCVLDLSPVYAVVSSMISFYLPCIAMTFFYFRLHRYARRHAEIMKRAGYYTKPALVVNDGAAADEKLTPRRTLSRGGGGSGIAEHKAAITLGVIMGVFLLCWVPFFSINLVAAFCRCVPPLVFSAFTWLGYLNSTMNPVIYSVFNRQFRDAFKRVLHIRRRYGSVTGGDGTFYRGSDWDEPSRTQSAAPPRRRTENGRLSARASVSEPPGGVSKVIRSSSSCRDMATYSLHTSCL